ncbi:bladder cancer-associated protein [Vespula squamosa]|uniref:Bladder cancer-associated protein n=1 Tax=Vespula squamosa TaxID=30214 RepID=A0ABD2A501_VESSQ
MYCLQWLLPVLLIPKPVNPALLQTHVMFMALYLIGFFLERKPCNTCGLVFLVAIFLICYSGIGNCFLWSKNCDTVRCANDISIVLVFASVFFKNEFKKYYPEIVNLKYEHKNISYQLTAL